MTTIRIRAPGIPHHIGGWSIINNQGLPRFWPTAWQSLHGGHLQESTIGAKLTAIDRLYRYTADITGGDCLDLLLTKLDFVRIEPLLHGFFSMLRNEADRTASDRSANDWQVAFAFISDMLDRLGSVQGTRDLDIFQANMLRLERLYRNLSPARPRKRKVIRALPAGVIEDLYEIVEPSSARNPFRSEAQRWRNFCLYLLMLHEGLRRSEALLLPANPIRSGFNQAIGEQVDWINIVETDEGNDPFDPRRNPPRIKTLLSRRQIPIGPDLVEIVTHFVDNFRGKQSHPFLFSSNRSSPLSVRMVNKIFERLTSKLSEGAAKELRNRLRDNAVSPHNLRHTAAVYRLSQFIDGERLEMDLALQLLRAFFGWSKDSKMPTHYAHAYFEGRMLQTVWRHKFDSHVDLIRTLRPLEDDEKTEEKKTDE